MLAKDLAIQRAAWNSLMTAVETVVCTSVSGTLATFAVYRYRPRTLTALVIVPVAISEVLTSVSLLSFFASINLELGLLTVVLSRITFYAGFVAAVVCSRLEGLDDSLIDAACDLGVTPFQAIWHVVLSLILPRAAAGALLVFTLSVDDSVVTFFASGPRQPMLSIQIYLMIRIAVTSEVNVVSSILMLVAPVVSLAAFWMLRDVWRVHV